jgi:cytochrome c peroxidase
MRFGRVIALVALSWIAAMVFGSPFSIDVVETPAFASDGERGLNRELREALRSAGFTGDIERTFKKRLKNSLGRPFNPQLADLGRLLFFDKIHSLNGDNSCGGCHTPTHGMGDSQPMAIGVQNNNVVGPHRTGPRNQRRTPTVVNTALYPRLMWNSRFESLSGDPFDPSRGFSFPVPEDDFPFTPVRFSSAENARNGVTHLLQAQAHMPPTELIEVAGFTGTCPGGVPDPWLGPRFCQFDLPNSLARVVPRPDATGFRNEPIRQAALAALNASPAYRQGFGKVFKDVKKGAPINFFHFGKAIAEFEFNLVFADAPIDRFARGDDRAMSDSEKRGALLFFGKANCASCHRVDGQSNEMFSDFKDHVVGVPQIFPSFGVNTGNFVFSGPGENEDFGREERTGDARDRYAFRTAPLRNLAVSPAYFHNGAFTELADAIRFHLNVVEGAQSYDPDAAGVPADLAQVGPVIGQDLIDPLLRRPVRLTRREVSDLVRFVRDSLLDERVHKSNLCGIIPGALPSGLSVGEFEGCRDR